MTCPSLPASNLYLPCVRTCRHAIGRRWNENQLCDILEPRAVKKSRKLLAAAAEIHIFRPIFQWFLGFLVCFYFAFSTSGRIEWVQFEIMFRARIHLSTETAKFLNSSQQRSFPMGIPRWQPVALFAHNLSTSSSGSRPAKYAAMKMWWWIERQRSRKEKMGTLGWDLMWDGCANNQDLSTENVVDRLL